MKNFWWLSALLVVALAAGCSDDADDKTPATDSGATADTVAGSDTAAGSDAGGTADAGPTCLPSPYTPSAAEVTYYAKGCSEPADLQYLGSLQADTTKGDKLRATITACLLTGGCGGKAKAEGVPAAEKCAQDCILKDAPAGIGSSCALCYAINGVCGYDKCLLKCAADSASQGCKDCMACNCDALLQACQQLPKS